MPCAPGHGEHLCRFVERLNFKLCAPAQTVLKLCCDGELTPEDPNVLVDKFTHPRTCAGCTFPAAACVTSPPSAPPSAASENRRSPRD